MYSVPTYMVSPKKGDFELRSNSVSLNDEIDNLDKSCSFFSLQYVFAILFVSRALILKERHLFGTPCISTSLKSKSNVTGESF